MGRYVRGFCLWTSATVSNLDQRDLELPHVPHMTTITSAIIPTERLTRWRSEHPERYPFVLSDSLSPRERAPTEHSCIRNRKAWLIENTFYVSSRDGGTFPLHTPNPKEFHEMQWCLQQSDVGKMVDEREVSICGSERPSDRTPGDDCTPKSTASFDKSFQDSTPRSSLIKKIVARISKDKKQVEYKQGRQSWLLSALSLGTGTLDRHEGDSDTNSSIPLPGGCYVPNASFARKHLLVDTTGPLPSRLPMRHMPVAESKATETFIEAAKSGLLQKERTWNFKGPFTPQLGYDGGLDYRWTQSRPDSARCTFESLRGPTNVESPNREEEEKIPWPSPADSSPRTKRRGFYFGLNSARDWLTGYHRQILSTQATASPDKAGKLSNNPNKKPQAKQCSCPVIKDMRDMSMEPPVGPLCGRQKNRRRWRSPLQFDNIQFMTPTARNGKTISESHRKTTVVQAPPTLPALRRLPSIVDDLKHTGPMCCLMRKQSLSPSPSTMMIAADESESDKTIQCCDCMEDMEQDVSFLSPQAIDCI